MSGLSVRAYDYETGQADLGDAGAGENTVPQPVQLGDLVFAMSGHTVKMLMAIRLGGTGTLNGSRRRRVVHAARRVLHAVAAAARRPAVRRDRQRPAELSRRGDRQAVTTSRRACRSRTTSRPHRSAPTASSISRPKKVTSSSSRWANTFEVLATNTLADQSFIASPVDRRRAMFLRSRTHLFRIGSAVR